MDDLLLKDRGREVAFEKPLFRGVRWDPELKKYYHEIISEIEMAVVWANCNQLIVFFDIYTLSIIKDVGSSNQVLGVDLMEVKMVDLVKKVHPVDRVVVSKLINETVNKLCRRKSLHVKSDVFLCDFRFKKNGDFIRLLCEVGCVAKDRCNNALVISITLTDVSGLKESSKVGYRFFEEGYTNDMKAAKKFRKCSLFSGKEIEVLELLEKGYESVEIAEMLFISRHTVDVHRRRMLQKCLAKNTIQLIHYARKNGYLV
jgi:DNA-binding CsgD family transcriptional regulator